MEKLPPSTGWLWVKQGFGLFRKQPGGLSTLFLGYMFCLLLVSIVPVLGHALQLIMVPVLSVAFLQACLHIEQGKPVFPTLLLSGFRSPAVAQLFALGVAYLAVVMFVLGASTLVDDGVLWQMLSGQLEGKEDVLKDSNIGNAILLAMALYVPAAMAFCFAAALIYWQKMSVGKATFFSFFTVLRSAPAFIVFAACWFAIIMVATQLLLAIFGRDLAMKAMLPLMVILSVTMQCSFYASYRHIFGVPDAAASDKPAP